jgi:hypothetical protein
MHEMTLEELRQAHAEEKKIRPRTETIKRRLAAYESWIIRRTLEQATKQAS